jgi:hypothetical protein
MDTKQLQQLLKQAGSVVILDDKGQPVAVTVSWATWLRTTGADALPEPPIEEVPISSRWPKAPRLATPEQASRQDQILERLNKEILALKAQMEHEETAVEQ